MVAATGYLKLTDLGSAKKVDKSRTFTAIGTEEYIPPEVLRGHGRDASALCPTKVPLLEAAQRGESKLASRAGCWLGPSLPRPGA